MLDVPCSLLDVQSQRQGVPLLNSGGREIAVDRLVPWTSAACRTVTTREQFLPEFNMPLIGLRKSLICRGTVYGTGCPVTPI